MTTEATIVSLFLDRVSSDGDRPAVWYKQSGEPREKTWQQLFDDVARLAAVFEERGIETGDRIVQVSENRYEWIVCDLAIQLALAVHVPVHAPLTGPQIAFQIKDSGAKLVLVSTQEQADKLGESADKLPNDVQFISFDSIDSQLGNASVPQLAKLIDAVDDSGTTEIAARARQQVTPDSIATILYTSGTTGEPKGVVLTQRNLATNTLGVMEIFAQSADDTRLTFLPLSHIFARTCDLYTWIAKGSKLALAQSRETVLADCAKVKPTLINAVPYFYDKVMQGLTASGMADTPGALRGMLGGSVRFCCSGGAGLPEHLFRFFRERDVPILEGYGLTETSPVMTASPLHDYRPGRVGPAIPGVDVKIAEDGEVLCRGPNVMLGYFNSQAATDEVIRNGWFHTGDIGELDDDGYLAITGRKKELIVTALGKNIAPVLLESLLTADPLIAQAMVIGDGRNYLSALIVPDPDNLRAEIISRSIAVMSREQALVHPEVLALYQQQIELRLAEVSHHEQVRKFTLMGRGFTIESGELTPKMSLRRKAIAANCADHIKTMYKESE